MQQSEFLHGVPLYNMPDEEDTAANQSRHHHMSVDSQADNLLLKDKEEAPGLFTILKRNAAAAGIDLRTQSAHSAASVTPNPIEEEVEEGTSQEGSQPVIHRDLPIQRANSEESEYVKKEGD